MRVCGVHFVVKKPLFVAFSSVVRKLFIILHGKSATGIQTEQIMMNNRIKRNLWMIMSVVMGVIGVERSVRFFDGSEEWWKAVSAFAIAAVCARCFICYRKAVRSGNLDGEVKPFG